MLGSHYDTVRDAGKWDGPLGLITAISCVVDLNRRGKRLPFAIEVTGFADEEGVRFASTLLGSRAVAGTFDESAFGARDQNGVSIARRCARSASIPTISVRPRAFAANCSPISSCTSSRDRCWSSRTCRSASSPQSRARRGLRRDRPAWPVTPARCRWRCGATRWRSRRMHRRDRGICRTDANGLVGTVGYIHAMPGATNVIPGQVSFTIDIRAPTDAHRKLAVTDIVRRVEAIAGGGNWRCSSTSPIENRTAPCSPWLRTQIADAISAKVFPCSSCRAGRGMTAWR